MKKVKTLIYLFFAITMVVATICPNVALLAAEQGVWVNMQYDGSGSQYDRSLEYLDAISLNDKLYIASGNSARLVVWERTGSTWSKYWEFSDANTTALPRFAVMNGEVYLAYTTSFSYTSPIDKQTTKTTVIKKLVDGQWVLVNDAIKYTTGYVCSLAATESGNLYAFVYNSGYLRIYKINGATATQVAQQSNGNGYYTKTAVYGDTVYFNLDKSIYKFDGSSITRLTTLSAYVSLNIRLFADANYVYVGYQNYYSYVGAIDLSSPSSGLKDSVALTTKIRANAGPAVFKNGNTLYAYAKSEDYSGTVYENKGNGWRAVPGNFNGTYGVFTMSGVTLYMVTASDNGSHYAYSCLIGVDKTALEDILAEADALMKEYYTPATWAQLMTAVSAGRAVYDNEDATQAEVNNAVAQIRAAIRALQVSINKEALGITIKSSQKLVQSEYAPESWAAMLEKREAAINVYNAVPGDKITGKTSTLELVTQEDVDNANSELLAAMAALQGNPRTVVEVINEQVSDLDSSAFTPGSWVHFSNMLSKARAAAEDPDASDEEIQEHLNALISAMSALKSAVILPSFPDVYIIDDENDKAYIYGVVDATVISAEVTLSNYFHIAPNAPESERFVSPDISIKNTCNAPLAFQAVSMKATGTAPKVVAPDTFENWSVLGSQETKANIALGFTGVPDGDFWFADEDEQQPVSLCTLGTQESCAFNLESMFGLSWPESQNFKYDLVVSLGLVQG